MGFTFKSHQSQKVSKLHNAADTGILHLNDLTKSDRAKYSLTIILAKLTKDPCGPNNYFYPVTAILKNNSKDTLTYLDYTCSHFIWETDNQLLWAYQPTDECYGCNANFMTHFIVLPGKSKTIFLHAIFRKNIKPAQTNFRVGMILQRVINFSDDRVYFRYFQAPQSDNRLDHLSKQKQNLIWSNFVSIHTN